MLFVLSIVLLLSIFYFFFNFYIFIFTYGIALLALESCTLKTLYSTPNKFQYLKTRAFTPSKYKPRPLLSRTYMFDLDVNVWSWSSRIKDEKRFDADINTHIQTYTSTLHI